MRLLVVYAGLLAGWTALAQDIDNVVTPDGRKPFTFLDQISDQGERADFLRVYNERQSIRRRALAESFLKDYPQSWLLAQAFEIAAKAAIDLDDLPQALQYGNESLRLLPENPILLVPLANVQVQLKQFQKAEASANDALEYLDRFGRPAGIAQSEWPQIEGALKASGYYVLGRVAATQGLASQGTERIAKLQAAVVHLSRGRELNAGDGEIAFLLGLVQRALGNNPEAAAQFTAASRSSGPLQLRARRQLADLERLKTATVPHRPPAPVIRLEAGLATATPARYAGSQSCRNCHAGQHANWEHTGMARMFRPYRRENVIGDFVAREFQDEAGAVQARMKSDAAGLFFETRGAGGGWKRYRVDYTIGSKWQQAFATRAPDGQIHVFPLQYNILEKSWLNYWKLIDPPDSERINPDGFHQLKASTNYQLNCAPCHTSQLGAPKREGARPQDLEFRESGVNCEMCHGPSAVHVSDMAAGRPGAKRTAGAPLDFKTLDHREYVRICAQCHMQSAMRELGPAGEYNYAASGDSFAPRYRSRPFVEFSRRAFYKDGRFRETTFIVEAFLRSACYRRGQASCGNCHDPHPPDAANNPVSLKYRDRPDQMCTQCHQKIAAMAEKHTHHQAGSEGSRCASCHMPRIMNSVLFQARTHQIDDIPRPDMTTRFGQQESPNSCMICHRDKDAAWVARQLRSFKDAKAVPALVQ